MGDPHKLYKWKQGGGQTHTEDWFCIEYDHSPFCRKCVRVMDYPVETQELILNLLREIAVRDEEIEDLDMLLKLARGTLDAVS